MKAYKILMKCMMRCCGDTMDNFDVIVYTDGACKGNPGMGGWGC